MSLMGNRAKKKAIKLATQKAVIKGEKKINKSIIKADRIIARAVRKTEKKFIKKANSKLKVRKCMICGKQRLAKSDKCINCKLDTMLKYLGRFEKLIDTLIKHIPTKGNN